MLEVWLRSMSNGLPALFLTVLLVTAPFVGSAAAEPRYAWRDGSASGDTLASRIAPPPGFERGGAAPASFAAWLRGLPLKAAGAPVLLHTGAPKLRQDVHVAVSDIDGGPRAL